MYKHRSVGTGKCCGCFRNWDLGCSEHQDGKANNSFIKVVCHTPWHYLAHLIDHFQLDILCLFKTLFFLSISSAQKNVDVHKSQFREFRELESINFSSSIAFPSLDSSTIFAYLPPDKRLSLSKSGLGFCYRIWVRYTLFLWVLCVQMLTRMSYMYFLS